MTPLGPGQQCPDFAHVVRGAGGACRGPESHEALQEVPSVSFKFQGNWPGPLIASPCLAVYELCDCVHGCKQRRVFIPWCSPACYS